MPKRTSKKVHPIWAKLAQLRKKYTATGNHVVTLVMPKEGRKIHLYFRPKGRYDIILNREDSNGSVKEILGFFSKERKVFCELKGVVKTITQGNVSINRPVPESKEVLIPALEGTTDIIFEWLSDPRTTSKGALVTRRTRRLAKHKRTTRSADEPDEAGHPRHNLKGNLTDL